MPAQTRRTETTTTQGASQTQTAPENDTLQDPLKDSLKEGAGGGSAGLANYQSSLGKWLGTELYGALANELTLPSLQEHATSAWKSALKSGIGALDALDENDKEAGAFTEALQAAYGDAAANLLETDVGKRVIGKLNGFVDANPRLILLVALLAAGGAVAANVPLPKFKETFDLGAGFTAKAGADLGKIRDIALKDLSAALEYNSGPLMAAVSVERNEEGEVSGDFKAQLGDEAKYLKTDGTFTNDGITVFGAKGLFTREDGGNLKGGITGGKDKPTLINGSITSINGDITTTNSVDYDASSGLIQFKNVDVAKLGDGGTIKAEDGSASDGTSYTGMSVAGKVGDNSTGSAGIRQNTGADGAITAQTDAALNYKKDTFTGGLSGNYTEGKGGSFTGTAANQLNERTRLGGSLTQNFGETSSTSGKAFLDYKADDLTLAAKYGFNTAKDEQTGSLSADYAKDGLKLGGAAGFNTTKNAFNANAYAQTNLGNDWKARVDGGYKTSDAGMEYDAGALAYRKVNKDLSVFAGGSVKHDDLSGTRFVPKAGVEVKGIPLQYSYDPATKQHKVGVTLFKW